MEYVIELPLIVKTALVFAMLAVLIGVTCVVIDTIINVKTYLYWKRQIKREELETKLESMVDSKIATGGGNYPLQI